MNTKTYKLNKTALLTSAYLICAVTGVIPTGNVHAEAITADFNNDGFEDIVFGDPSRSAYSGVVSVIETDSLGLRSGLRAKPWFQNHLNSSDGTEINDEFGNVIGIGDFNGDGYDDMAVGARQEKVDNVALAGAVNVIYGTNSGLNRSGNQTLHSYDPQIADRFGTAVAVGDFNADGYDDLAVGIPNMSDINSANDEIPRAGGVAVFLGSSSGLNQYASYLRRSSRYVEGSPQQNAEFGKALAAGDIDGDGYDDLLIGAPKHSIGPYNGTQHVEAGSVTLVYGASYGMSIQSLLFRDVNEANNAGDHFGSTLAVGNFNGDSYADFAIGHAGERVGNRPGAGAVSLFNGHRRRVFIYSSRQLWYQNRSGVPGTSESGDAFGAALTVGDFDDNGYDDLAVGIPGEDIEVDWGFDKNSAGAALVIYNRNTGPFIMNSSSWHQGRFGVEGGPESGDIFGKSLSVGDYNNDGVADLLVGVPGEKVSGVSGQGILQMIPGRRSTGLRPIGGLTQIYHRNNLRGVSGALGKVLTSSDRI